MTPHAHIAAARASLREARKHFRAAGYATHAELLTDLLQIERLLIGDWVHPDEHWPIPKSLRDNAGAIADEAEAQMNTEDTP